MECFLLGDDMYIGGELASMTTHMTTTRNQKETARIGAHHAFIRLKTLLIGTAVDGNALRTLCSDMGYLAPELENKRWNKIWEFILTHIVPFDDEPWTTPIREYWQSVVPTTRQHAIPSEQAASETSAKGKKKKLARTMNKNQC